MWLGQLNLVFERSGPKTVIAQRRHQGPLMVQRAFYEADGGCQAYVLHPPGGVVGGDRLSMNFNAGRNSRALVTTPAATKIYRSPDRVSLQEQSCRVETGGVFEWLPQETIVYDGARAQIRTQIDLCSGAQFVGWEITCLGHDDRGFTRGHLVQHWKIDREGRPLWSERAVFEGGGLALTAHWGLAGRPVVAALVATGTRPEHVEAIRAALPAAHPDWFSVTRVGEVLICRYLGYSAEAAKRLLCAGWAILRQGVSGREACHPRVWAT